MFFDKRGIRNAMRLYAVTDDRWLRGRTLAQAVEEAILGGATCIQLRDKGRSSDELRAQAEELLAVTRRYRVPLILNDDVEAAAACGADGVHLGQDDMDLSRARKLLGPDRIIGVSAHTVEEALAAEKSGADYLGAGAVFSTGTKQDTSVLPMERLRAICGAVSIPVAAIGGIGEENAARLAGSGIAGIAVVSAIFGAQDIRQAASRLTGLLQDVL